MVLINKACELCFQPAISQCSNCKKNYYCSIQHQKLLWKYHKYICGTVPIRTNKSYVTVPKWQLIECDTIILNSTADEPHLDPIKNGRCTAQQYIDGQNKVMNKMYPEEWDRNRVMTLCRGTTDSELSKQWKSKFYKDSSLGPYYRLSNLTWIIMNVPRSIYSFEFFEEIFYQECLLDLGASSNRKYLTLELILWLESSLIRLEIIFKNLVKEGKDGDLFYTFQMPLRRENVQVMRLVFEGKIDGKGAVARMIDVISRSMPIEHRALFVDSPAFNLTS